MTSRFRNVVATATLLPHKRAYSADDTQTPSSSSNLAEDSRRGQHRPHVHYTVTTTNRASTLNALSGSSAIFSSYGACAACDTTPHDIQQWAIGKPVGLAGTVASEGQGFKPNSSDRNTRLSPERLRGEGQHQASLNRVPEEDTMDFEHSDEPAYIGGVPLNDDPEEIQRELEEELQQHGLYQGNLLLIFTSQKP
jgi:hypothetical protein